MLIWNQGEYALYNSDNISRFYVDSEYDTYCVNADSFILGEYSSYDDAIKELKELERQLIFGATTYKMP